MAYYVPGKRGVEVVSELVGRGVRVRILTNSLASTDVVAVPAGYSSYRAALLAAGVESTSSAWTPSALRRGVTSCARAARNRRCTPR
jgi:putative cardiolipin synthase